MCIYFPVYFVDAEHLWDLQDPHREKISYQFNCDIVIIKMRQSYVVIKYYLSSGGLATGICFSSMLIDMGSVFD